MYGRLRSLVLVFFNGFSLGFRISCIKFRTSRVKTLGAKCLCNTLPASEGWDLSLVPRDDFFNLGTPVLIAFKRSDRASFRCGSVDDEKGGARGAGGAAGGGGGGGPGGVIVVVGDDDDDILKDELVGANALIEAEASLISSVSKSSA